MRTVNISWMTFHTQRRKQTFSSRHYDYCTLGPTGLKALTCWAVRLEGCGCYWSLLKWRGCVPRSDWKGWWAHEELFLRFMFWKEDFCPYFGEDERVRPVTRERVIRLLNLVRARDDRSVFQGYGSQDEEERKDLKDISDERIGCCLVDTEDEGITKSQRWPQKARISVGVTRRLKLPLPESWDTKGGMFLWLKREERKVTDWAWGVYETLFKGRLAPAHPTDPSWSYCLLLPQG